MKDVHTEHCCLHCGCKYGEDSLEEGFDDEEVIGCTVVSGAAKQSLPCGKASTCQHDYSDERD